jgi:hypothetical protein
MMASKPARPGVVTSRLKTAPRAYFVGGFGMTALTANNANDNIVLVPIRSGVGLRLGANVGYLKFTPQATWNPF